MMSTPMEDFPQRRVTTITPGPSPEASLGICAGFSALFQDSARARFAGMTLGFPGSAPRLSAPRRPGDAEMEVNDELA